MFCRRGSRRLWGARGRRGRSEMIVGFVRGTVHGWMVGGCLSLDEVMMMSVAYVSEVRRLAMN